MAQLAMLDDLDRVIPRLDEIIRDGRLGRHSQQLVDEIQERVADLAEDLMRIATGGSTNRYYDSGAVTVRSRLLPGGGIAVF